MLLTQHDEITRDQSRKTCYLMDRLCGVERQVPAESEETRQAAPQIVPQWERHAANLGAYLLLGTKGGGELQISLGDATRKKT
jgi:hypothetical protein